MEKAIGLSESELLEKLNASKMARAKECGAKIDEVLKQFNCILTTNIHVLVNNEPVLPSIAPN